MVQNQSAKVQSALEEVKSKQGANHNHLAERLTSLVASVEDPDGFDANLLMLMRDLTNAEAAAFCAWTANDKKYHLVTDVGDGNALQTALQTHVAEPLSAAQVRVVALPQQKKTIYLIAQANLVEANDTANPQRVTLLALLAKQSTPFTDALAVERLSLCMAYRQFYAANVQQRGSAIGVPSQAALLALTADMPLDQRYQKFVDAVQKDTGVDELFLGIFCGETVRHCAVSNEPALSNASQTVASFKLAAQRFQKAYSPTREDQPCCRDPLWQLVPMAQGGHLVGVLGMRSVNEAHLGGVNKVQGAADQLAPFVSLVEHAQGRGISMPSLLAWLKAKKHRAKILACVALLIIMPIPDTTNATFKVSEVEKRVVTAPFDGILKSVEVDVEDSVTGGQTVLGSLSTEQIDLALSKEKTNFVAAKAEQALAQNKFEAADAKIAELKAMRASAEMDLLTYRKGMAQLKPQISGVITKSDFKRRVGSMVRRGETLFEISNVDQLRLDIFVPDNKISGLFVGARGQAALAAAPGVYYDFKVQNIHPVAETISTRTVFRVVAEFDDKPSAILRPGMEGMAKVDMGWSPLGWIAVRDALNYLRSRFWI